MEVNSMKNKKRFAFYAFSVLSILASIYSLLAYRYLKPLLNSQLTEQTPTMMNIELIIILALVIVGLYHIYLLVNSLKALPRQKSSFFLHSLYIVLVVLSGILIISDATILYDIGKEYKVWDVSGEWNLLCILTIFHAIVTIIGIVYTSRFYESGGIKAFFQSIRQGNDVLFLSLNQIAFICGILGIAGAIAIKSKLLVHYQASMLLTLSALVILPIVLFVIYWMLRNRKNIKMWIDEKQAHDTCFGALVALAVGMFTLCVAFFLSLFGVIRIIDLSLLAILFFLQLTVFSGVVSLKSYGA